jgi:hypothetical protein
MASADQAIEARGRYRKFGFWGWSTRLVQGRSKEVDRKEEGLETQDAKGGI